MGRPKLPPVIAVKIGKYEHDLAYKLVGFSKETPFRVVFQAMVSKMEVDKRGA
jgi:hypothetical protein